MAICISRLGDIDSSRWNSGRTEAIQFKTSVDVRLICIYMFYALGSHAGRARILRMKGDNESTAEEIWNGGAYDGVLIFREPLHILANTWHLVIATISDEYNYYKDGKNRVEEEGVVFEFRNSKQSQGTNVDIGLFDRFRFDKCFELFVSSSDSNAEKEQFRMENVSLKEKIEQNRKKEIEHQAKNDEQAKQILNLRSEIDKNRKREIELQATIDEQTKQITNQQAEIDKQVEIESKINEQAETILNHQSGIDKLCDALTKKNEECIEISTEIEQLKQENEEIRKEIFRLRFDALTYSKNTLKFEEEEKLAEPFICIQIENGTIMYFDNVKPFGLFTLINEIRIYADMRILDGESDCSFKGTIGNCAYFSVARGKIIRFIKASIINVKIVLEQINQLENSDLDLFGNEPFYFIDETTKWVVYQYHENYMEMEGEKFDFSQLRLIRKYRNHYHRGILYLFRENSKAKVEKVNDKIAIVEGPMLHRKEKLSFYNPPHSDLIYIANPDKKVLLTLNTTNLNVSQHCYEPPIESNNHVIVGVHKGILTMAFDGVAVPRCLMTTKLTQ